MKWATAALALVAVIGFPAVAIHLSRFEVPLGTASYNDVLRAGALPAAALLLVWLYCIAAGRALRNMGFGQFLALHSLVLIPLMVVLYLLFLAGTLSYLLIFVWAMLWCVRYALSFFFDTGLSNRDLLIISGWLVLIGGLVVFILAMTQKLWRDRQGEFWTILRGMTSSQPRLRPARAPTSEDGAASTPAVRNKGRFDWALIGGFAMSAPLILLMHYCIKWLLWLWDPQLGDYITHRYVIYASLASFVTFGFFFGAILVGASDVFGGRATAGQKWAVIATAIGMFVAFEVAFCTWGYGQLYSGFGGGRPQATTIWLKNDDDGKDITLILAKAEITDTGKLRRVDKVFVILDRQGELLLTDSPIAPAKALLVSKARLMATTW